MILCSYNMRDTIGGYWYNYQTYHTFGGNLTDDYAVLKGGRYFLKVAIGVSSASCIG